MSFIQGVEIAFVVNFESTIEVMCLLHTRDVIVSYFKTIVNRLYIYYTDSLFRFFFIKFQSNRLTP